ESHDDGYVDVADLLVGFHYAVGDPVATHDASDNVDKDGLNVGIFEDNPERGFHEPRVGTTAHIEEVGGLAAGEFDHVHGGHREPCTVDHTADVAVEFHVIEARLAGFYLQRIFFTDIPEFSKVFVTVEGVVVEVHLGVDGEDLVVRCLQ